MIVEGLLLAAGAGSRYGGPKVLAEGGAWLAGAVHALRAGGCAGVSVVLGAEVDRARPLVEEAGARTVVAPDWARGMSASLAAGLGAQEEATTAVLVHLVDLPDVTAAVVRRVLGDEVDEATLRRASYAGVPGHPVLLGRGHWAGALATAQGDAGARGYLQAHPATLAECGDLATGRDVDRPGG